MPDLRLRWTAIRGAINVVSHAPSGLWSVRVRQWEKVPMEAAEVIGEVQRYWEALYAKRPHMSQIALLLMSKSLPISHRI